jgi:hypothetical protein
MSPDEQTREYLRGLKVGERVVECGESCLKGRQGTVYISKSVPGSICVLWDKLEGEEGQMGSSVTWGARRLNETHLFP